MKRTTMGGPTWWTSNTSTAIAVHLPFEKGFQPSKFIAIVSGCVFLIGATPQNTIAVVLLVSPVKPQKQFPSNPAESGNSAAPFRLSALIQSLAGLGSSCDIGVAWVRPGVAFFETAGLCQRGALVNIHQNKNLRWKSIHQLGHQPPIIYDLVHFGPCAL